MVMNPFKAFFQLLVAQVAVAYGLLLAQTLLAQRLYDASSAYVLKILVVVGLLAAAVVWLGYLAYRKRWVWLIWLIVAGETLVCLGTLSRFGSMAHVFSGMLTGIVLAVAVAGAGIMAVRPVAKRVKRK